jgi:hypothetical protein
MATSLSFRILTFSDMPAYITRIRLSRQSSPSNSQSRGLTIRSPRRQQ